MATAPSLQPHSLATAPALIETIFPAQKLSFEAQRERKAGAGQTLTALGSYWKGRKPLILARALVLGCLLPPTDHPEKDLALFEQLLALDDESLARRALAKNAISPQRLMELLDIPKPERFFTNKHWRREVSREEKLALYREALATIQTYEEKSSLTLRPEEVPDQAWLYEPLWPALNVHYAHLGIDAHSFPELMEQLGMLRYGQRPKVGDAFCGGGSIPFEAARLGCDVYASDLNPIACMLTWGALHIIGAGPQERAAIEHAQRQVAEAVDQEITALGIEHDASGNRAKAYLYCLETRCPETGWMVPMAPSWVISKTRHVIAQLVPNEQKQRFEIEIKSGVSPAELEAAAKGTVQDGFLVYTLHGTSHRTAIKTLRGDYRLPDGSTANRLRRWEKSDCMPRPEDIFQERLYCIQWITKATLGASRQETFFAAPTDEDLAREQQVARLVTENLAAWQEAGLVPDMTITPGAKTDEPIRTRGWTHWHHLFNPRQLVVLATFLRELSKSPCASSLLPQFCKIVDHNSRLSRWNPGLGNDKIENVLYNQAFNTVYNYGSRALFYALNHWEAPFSITPITINQTVENCSSENISNTSDIWITDPPYADAINYHEITEFFIAWLRKNPPPPFDQWTWDSRRALAITGSGDDFRRKMVAAYQAMTSHMPDNGIQCVMFTHQDIAVWSDLVAIFWAAGLQVVSAWYIATETASELKQGGYVQGTVILALKKRPPGQRQGFRQVILPWVRAEVKRQIEAMMHLNDTIASRHGTPVWGEADLQMAGYAAALKVLTAFTHIGTEDMTTLALRPKPQGRGAAGHGVVDEIIAEAREEASNLLVPEGLPREDWEKLEGIERFVVRMLALEAQGVHKLDNYQNFARIFHVADFGALMAETRPNHARLKRIPEFTARDLSLNTPLGASHLGRLMVALQQRLKETSAAVIIEQLRTEMDDFYEARPLLVSLLAYIGDKSRDPALQEAAAILHDRLDKLRLGTHDPP